MLPSLPNALKKALGHQGTRLRSPQLLNPVFARPCALFAVISAGSLPAANTSMTNPALERQSGLLPAGLPPLQQQSVCGCDHHRFPQLQWARLQAGLYPRFVFVRGTQPFAGFSSHVLSALQFIPSYSIHGKVPSVPKLLQCLHFAEWASHLFCSSKASGT